MDRARDVLHVEEVRLAVALELDEGHDTRDKKRKDGREGRERGGRGEETKYSSSPSCSGIDSMAVLD